MVTIDTVAPTVALSVDLPILDPPNRTVATLTFTTSETEVDFEFGHILVEGTGGTLRNDRDFATTSQSRLHTTSSPRTLTVFGAGWQVHRHRGQPEPG